MRIAFLAPTFHPQRGPAEAFARRLLAALRAAGNDVHAVAGAAAGLGPVAQVDGVPVWRPGPARPSGLAGRAAWTARFARGAAGALDEIDPAVVLAHGSALPAARAGADRLGIPLVALVHEACGLGERIRHRGVREATARAASGTRLLARVRPDAVIATSTAVARRIERILDAPVTVARAGTDHLPEGLPPPASSTQIVVAGEAASSRGRADVLRAVARARRFAPATLLLAGAAERGALPPWARATGPLSDEEIERALRSSALLAFPSLRDTWGQVICEAAACGLPYAAYDVPAVREQHQTIGGGILVPPGNAEALGTALGRMLTSASTRAELAASGARRARSLCWGEAARAVSEAIGAARRRAGARDAALLGAGPPTG